jgi:hypothetical protein
MQVPNHDEAGCAVSETEQLEWLLVVCKVTVRMGSAPDSVTHKIQCTKTVPDARIVYWTAKKNACRIAQAGVFSDSV